MSDNEIEESAIPVGELARRSGVSTSAINYYVSLGLLPKPRKTGRTRALYTSSHERLIGRIIELKGRGLTLRVIKRALYSDDPVEELGIAGGRPARAGERASGVAADDAMSVDGFLKESGLSAEQYGRLARIGLLRGPRRVKGYERGLTRRDLEAARSCFQLLSAGVGLDVLSRHAEYEPLARAEAHLLAEHIIAASGSVGAVRQDSSEIELWFDALRGYLRRVQAEAAYPGWLGD